MDVRLARPMRASERADGKEQIKKAANTQNDAHRQCTYRCPPREIFELCCGMELLDERALVAGSLACAAEVSWPRRQSGATNSRMMRDMFSMKSTRCGCM
jgi:hypothetical protein